MDNLLKSTTVLAQMLVKQYICSDCTAVDATCGNGHDTLMLAASSAEKVYAFDIQPAALAQTRTLLSEHNISPSKVRLICDSHANIKRYLPKARIVMFNLGYLPGNDKTLTTQKDSTLKAVADALSILEKDGLCCIVMYDGHEAGAEEKAALLRMAEDLDPAIYHASYISMINQANHPPEILAITKKKQTL